MRYMFKFPDIGEGISEGKLLQWYVTRGQEIKSGDPLVQMETDKVVADIPSPKDGVIVMCFGKVGDIVRVGDALVELEMEGISPEQAREIALEKPKRKTVEPLQEIGFGVVGNLEVAGEGAHLPTSDEGRQITQKQPARSHKSLATPVARAMARELKLNIDEIVGTGPGGRVMKEDIQAHFQKQTLAKQTTQALEAPSVEKQPLSQIRKAIARRMTLSKQTAPHMTVFEEVEISSLLQIQQSQKDQFARRSVKLTLLPFIVKAVISGLKKYRALNSQIDMEQGHILYKYYYNIGIAVDAPDGLVVPVVHNADRMSIFELASAISTMAQKARDRKLTLDDMKDGTFSITNFGALAGLHAVPIINYPEVAILGVGRFRQMPIVKDGQIQAGTILPLSLSVDHRVVDGGEASRFIREVMDRISDPVSSLLG